MPLASPPTFAALPPLIQNDILSGMVDPVPVCLGRGLRLFRMVDRGRAGPVGQRSPWWIAECDYLRIVRDFARIRRDGNQRQRRAAKFDEFYRDACAVPYRWTPVGQAPTPAPLDVIESGDLRADLWAFMGRGRAQPEILEHGLTRTWPGWQDITQLFLHQLSRHAPVPEQEAALGTIVFGASNRVRARPTMYRDGP
jgi:hypothetical protein